MKTCTKCKKNLPEENFPWKKKDVKRGSWCKPCQRIAGKENYNNNKERYQLNSKTSRPKYQKRNKDFVMDYLRNNPCVDCGETDIIVLEFDHREPVLGRGNRISNFYHSSLEKLKSEIAKCDVVCCNCHARRTANYFGSFRLDYI